MREYKKNKASRIAIGTKIVRRRKGNAKRPVGQQKSFFAKWNGEKG